MLPSSMLLPSQALSRMLGSGTPSSALLPMLAVERPRGRLG